MATGAVGKLPLVAITGPTASGKTALAIELAEKHGGEIICADSRTIYTGMDIGTAKPTAEEQARVPHWGPRRPTWDRRAHPNRVGSNPPTNKDRWSP